MEYLKAELPRICINCGYGEDSHNTGRDHGARHRQCPPYPALLGNQPRPYTFEPVACVVCGDPALAGLKSAPRCEWCLAGPKGLFEAAMFLNHARDYVAHHANTLYGSDPALHHSLQRAVFFLDHAAEHVAWLLQTAGGEPIPPPVRGSFGIYPDTPKASGPREL